MVEKRQALKQTHNTTPKDAPAYCLLDSQQQALKILTNALIYGIFVEMNPDEKVEEQHVFSNTQFETTLNKIERPGSYFNPIIAVMLTSGARLLLGLAEYQTKQQGCTHAYMDTDSIALPPHIANDVSSWFDPLNPYSTPCKLLKVEKHDRFFYGISSKRYVLYEKQESNIVIKDNEYKLYGLGYLQNPFPNGVKR